MVFSGDAGNQPSFDGLLCHQADGPAGRADRWLTANDIAARNHDRRMTREATAAPTASFKSHRET